MGLGLGSLAGGRISRSHVPLVPVFAAVELGTAVYGAFSLRLFHRAAEFTAGASTLRTGICAFALIVTPTLLMGSTLPILLAYLVRRVPNMGRATGTLYFVNTLGSATACFVVGAWAMRVLGMSGAVRLAACINALIACAAFLAWSVLSRRTSNAVSTEYTAAASAPSSQTLGLTTGIVLAGLSGFIALGYEIVWYRVFSWASATNPQTFAFMLGFYLAGLAIGSLVVERRCGGAASQRDHQQFAGLMLIAGNLLAVSVAPVLSWVARFQSREQVQLIGMLVLAAATAMLGTTFPMVCHLSVAPDGVAGQRLSFLYVSNIVGSAAGSFIAGYLLTEFLQLARLAAVFGIAGILLGWLFVGKSQGNRVRNSIFAGAGILTLLVLVGPSYRGIYERLNLPQVSTPFSELVENRHGVVAVGGDDGLTVFGGGIYDGRFNIDPLHDINGARRCYSLFGYLSRPPKHVLMIGLSSGSWAQIVANHPQVESLTIVEINPGYLQIIPKHPEVASLLKNPKVKVVIDDGHRWLLRNPTAKFDLVVMNTTYFWRANATNLLSREFLELIRQHLEPGGAHFYNTTSSRDALFTAVSVFPYAVRIHHFIAVSDAPLVFHAGEWQKIMKDYRIDGRVLIDPTRRDDQDFLNDVQQLASLATTNPYGYFELQSTLRPTLAGRTVVTDDNMAVEWRGEQP